MTRVKQAKNQSTNQINWIRLEKNYPQKIDEFYNWLAFWIERQPRHQQFSFNDFFKLSPRFQFAVFLEFLKDDLVDDIDCNVLNLADCIAFVEDYFMKETHKINLLRFRKRIISERKAFSVFALLFE